MFPRDNGKKPYFINEKGIEWYHEESSNEYAKKEDSHRTTLDIACFILRDKDKKNLTRLIIDKKTNEVVYESDSLEGIGVNIDIMKVLKRCE